MKILLNKEFLGFTGLLFCLTGLLPACVSTQASTSKESQSRKLYWKVYPKSDNTFYILPRPELTAELSTPESMNKLREEKARAMAAKLNAELQFKVQASVEGGSRMIRIIPEPLLEDIIEICKAKEPHPFLQSRCKKELAWAEKGIRPDIYLQWDECEAVVTANALNTMYGKNKISPSLCPALNQVEK